MLKKEERLHFFKNMKKTWYYLKECKWFLVGYVIFNIFSAIIGIVLPIVASKKIISLTTGEMEQLLYTSLLVSGILVLNHIVHFLNSLMYREIYKKGLLNLQLALEKETLKLKVEEIDKNTTGLFIDRLTKDTGNISTIFADYINLITRILSHLGVGITIFMLNKYVFVYVFLTSLILFLLHRRVIKKKFKIQKDFKILREKKTGFINETIRGIRDIKVLNAIDSIIEEFNKKIVEVFEVSEKISKLSRNNNFILSNLETFFNLLFIILIIFMYKNSWITIPAMVLAYNYKGRIESFLSGINNIYEYNEDFLLTTDRIFEVIEDEKFSKEKFGDLEVKKLEGNIKFENVGFAYTEGKEILKNVSFEIKANEKIAFVGKSGAGKTTIFNLITKLYNRTSGNILLDNYDIDKLDRNSLRDNMSIITQNPYIFNFSIKDNLLLAKPDASIDEIQEACKLACIDEYISGLEKGYDTIVGENGIILSGGQKQRLAIARALLMKTEIILLDEATSALDNETQSEIQKAIENLKGEYTILIIAHRLSTVIDSDRIFVVDNGQIVDTGTHEELLKNSEYYKGLYKKELKV